MSARRWLPRILSLLLAPLLFLALLEGGLRAVGYGRDTAFFVATPDGAAWSSNPAFGRRFFAPAYQIRPEPARIPQPKPPDELRVVVLGGSAAFGDLDRGYGFGRFLEAMLELGYPERRIRVVNAALPGANSHLMRLVARDAARLQPDLFVVLLGNNEVVGPFGPGAFVAAGEPRMAPLWALRLGLALGETRVGQLLAELLARPLGPRTLERPAAGEDAALPVVAADDPRLARTYARFAANLDAVADAAREAGAALLLATVPVNLRDSEPVRPLHAPGLDPAALERWRALVAEGDFLRAQRDPRAALERYRQAAQIDPGNAALHFAMARSLDALGEAEAADAAFARARDLDGLRARADSELNAALRRAAERHPQAALLDLERELTERAPGRRLFYDHVHFTLRGNYEVARRVFAALPELLPLPPREPPDFARVRAALPVTPWDRLQLARRLALRGLLPGQTRAAPPPVPPRSELREAERRYREKLARVPDDWVVLGLLTELQLALGLPEAALNGSERLADALPRAPGPQRLRAEALLALDRPEAALAAFDAALTLDPLDREARLGRGRLRARLGDRAGALADLEEALRLRPGDAELRGLLEELRATLPPA